MVLSVSGLSGERKRVEWILWVLLVENIIFTVIPIWEASHIAGSHLDWLFWVSNFLVFWHFLNWLLLSEINFVCCGEVHFMWVDDFSFFFKVKRFFMVANISLAQFSIVVLSVV